MEYTLKDIFDDYILLKWWQFRERRRLLKLMLFYIVAELNKEIKDE